MEDSRTLHPLSGMTACVTDGAVRLRWNRNPRFAESHADIASHEYASFRIWRKQVAHIPDDCRCHTFGMEGAECLHDGPLAETEGACQWTDTPSPTDIAVRHFVYFIASRSARPVELLPVAVRNPALWWTYETLMDRLQRLHAAQPGTTALDVAGQTASGRDIPRLTAGRGVPAIAIIGLIHAGESGPELMVPVIERLLEEEPGLLARTRIIAVPAVNIDHRERMVRGYPRYLRTNAAGIDINRNFPADWEETSAMHGVSNVDPASPTFRGFAPACAPETRAVMTALSDPDLRAVFSCHWTDSLCAFPALSCEACADDPSYVAASRRMVMRYAEGLYPEHAYEAWFHGLETTGGSLATWCYRTRRLPAFDLEGGSIQIRYGTDDRSPFTTAMLDDYRQRHFRAIRNILLDLVDPST